MAVVVELTLPPHLHLFTSVSPLSLFDHIFLQVGELLSFADSPGGRISRKVTPRERKLGTLFGKFLDNGERGLVQGQLLLLEMAGLLLSPVTLFIRLLGFVYGQVAQRTWYHVERCAYPMHSFAAGNLTLVQNDTIQTELRSLGAFVPVTTVDVCKLILQSDVEGSVVADALSVLDYTRYSAVMTFLDVWGEALETPAYTWEVIYRAPLMYWDYYVLGRTAQLPPRRQCCLLRAGIDAAREEMERLKQRLAAKEALISETASKRYVPLSVSGPSNVPASSASSSAKKRGRRDEAERKVLLDLGPEGSWESVLNTCLETKREVTAEALAPGEQTAPPHFYRFCFFGEITQDGVRSLGRFAYWGEWRLC